MKVINTFLLSFIFSFTGSSQQTSKLFLDEYTMGINYTIPKILIYSKQSSIFKDIKSINYSHSYGINLGAYHTYSAKKKLKLKLGIEYNYTETKINGEFNYDTKLIDTNYFQIFFEKISTNLLKHSITIPVFFRYDLTNKYPFYIDLGVNFNLFTLFKNSFSVDYYQTAENGNQLTYLNSSNYSIIKNKRPNFELVGGVGFKPNIFNHFSIKINYKYCFYNVYSSFTLQNTNINFLSDLPFVFFNPNFITLSINYQL